MDLLTWNCNGALRNKVEALAAFKADIYVIQECEDPARSSSKHYREWASNYLWKGDNKNRGIGIFARESIKLKPLKWKDEYEGHAVRHFLPCMVNDEIQLVNVWACQNNSKYFGYIGQFWKYMELHKKKFRNIILAGDFNSNSIWDHWDRWWNHTDVVNDLAKMDIHSLYHSRFKEKQGHEKQPTFLLHRNTQKPYHIDYVFASKEIRKRLKKFEVAGMEEWLRWSDHLPIFCSLMGR